MMPGRVLPVLLVLAALTGCGLVRGASEPPPAPHAGRTGVDRQAPASGLAADRRRARHDAEDGATDESRGQAVGSIVPRGSPSAKDAPLPPLPTEPPPVPKQ